MGEEAEEAGLKRKREDELDAYTYPRGDGMEEQEEEKEEQQDAPPQPGQFILRIGKLIKEAFVRKSTREAADGDESANAARGFSAVKANEQEVPHNQEVVDKAWNGAEDRRQVVEDLDGLGEERKRKRV